MKVFLIIGFISFASAFKECGKRGNSNRIINGQHAGFGEFPWQVSLQVKPPYAGGIPVHSCGGTLILDRWVLSAAHCFVGGRLQDKSNFRVRLGEWKLGSTGEPVQDFEISELYLHERFNIDAFYDGYDIALLKLDRPVDVTGPNVGTACLPKLGDDFRGAENCVLSGWGYIDKDAEGRGSVPDQLRKAEGDIWEESPLRKIWDQAWRFPWSWRSFADNILGFGNPGSWSACQGDSGGPLACKNKAGDYAVVGIVSYGPPDCGTANSRVPGMFTEVVPYLYWIKEKIVKSDGSDGSSIIGGADGSGSGGGGGGGSAVVTSGMGACKHGGMTVPHESNCRKYYYCHDVGQGRTWICNEGDKFDKIELRCVSAEKATCRNI